MDFSAFSISLEKSAASFVSLLLKDLDLPRSQSFSFVQRVENFLQQDSITSLFMYLLIRLKELGESADKVASFANAMQKLQKPFDNFRTESQCLHYFENKGTYIPPQTLEIQGDGYEKCSDKEFEEGGQINVALVQFIPLRKVLKKFFELPNMFESTIQYCKSLESKSLITNVIQAEAWKKKKSSFGDRLVLPMLLYQDDFETNNPLGSHRGIGKVGGVYVVLPCLPPHLRSKTENIHLLTMYKAHDEKKVSLHKILATAIEELNFLEEQGIEIITSSGSVNVHFALAGVIGDNLAMNTLLGFVRSFSANHFCRFCLMHAKDINIVYHESQCEMRTHENFSQHLITYEPSLTGVSDLSVFTYLNASSIIDLLTTDVMHDILEGIWEYDSGIIFNHFIEIQKLFTVEDLNKRIKNLTYGENENRNLPRLVTDDQIKNKRIKMSASEALCFINNVGVLVGEFIPVGNKYWRIIILLKEILDIATSYVVHEGLALRLESLVREYLESLTALFPTYLKPKHHFLIHYATIMRRLGPLWNLSTMRCEHKNHDFKVTSHVSLSRVNISKTLSMKSQLVLNHRLLCNISADKDDCERGPSREKNLWEIDFAVYFVPFLNLQANAVVKHLEYIIFRNKKIKDNVIMIPNEEHRFFLVHVIIEDQPNILRIITTDITDYTLYEEHYQAYRVHESALTASDNWRILTLADLEGSSISRLTSSGSTPRETLFIPKRWV